VRWSGRSRARPVSARGADERPPEVVGRERPSTRQPLTSDTGEIDRPVVGLQVHLAQPPRLFQHPAQRREDLVHARRTPPVHQPRPDRLRVLLTVVLHD
jgi:hypothetical protein